MDHIDLHSNRLEHIVMDYIFPIFIGAVMLLAIIVFIWLGYEVLTGKMCTGIQCRDAYVQECLATERYSRDECIRLASGK